MDSFDIEFCPPAYRESKRLEFEKLTQGTIYVIECEKNFKELSQFGLFMILDDKANKQRFLNGLNEHVATGVLGAHHPTCQALQKVVSQFEAQMEMPRP